MAIYTCPNCGDEMELPPDAAGQVVACPHCAGEFTAPASEIGPTSEEELSTIRIKRMTLERRAAIRARSYCLIAAGGCAVGAAQFIYFAANLVRSGHRATGYIVCAVIFAVLMMFFIQKAREA